MPRRPPPRPPATPPGSAEEGSALITAAAVSIFDKRDGTGADWRLMVESLFKAAFVMLEGLPEDGRHKVARRVHEGSNHRMLPGPLAVDSSASIPRPAGLVSITANTEDFKSDEPRPPN